jgi:hypothetical protein
MKSFSLSAPVVNIKCASRILGKFFKISYEIAGGQFCANCFHVSYKCEERGEF